MDSLTAARIQMTVSLAFHMVFAAIGIGMPLLMACVEWKWLRSGKPHYKELAKTWAKTTGLLFAVGAVSGTALALELGLLWPRYLEILGPVVGHIFGLEGYAFFLEAIFLGLYLYGWDRLSPWSHWACGVVIAFSGMMSGVFVLGVNAWMQQPVGFDWDGTVVTVTDPIAIFRQPLWLSMAIHSTLACYMSVGFAVAGWYAWQALRNGMNDSNRTGLRLAMCVGGVSALLQPLSGDLLAKSVYRTQPAKFAAMEGQFQTERRAPLRIGGWPDEERGETRWAIEIPGGLSFLATGNPDAAVEGLNTFPESERPNPEIVHLSFQAMVGSGFVLMMLTVWFLIAAFRDRNRYERFAGRKWLLRAIAISAPLGFLGLEAGWLVTEAGRQPWAIYKVIRVSDAVTPAEGVAAMLFTFSALYILLGGTVVALLRRLSRTPVGSRSGEAQ